jgi:hypothetical protein
VDHIRACSGGAARKISSYTRRQLPCHLPLATSVILAAPIVGATPRSD